MILLLLLLLYAQAQSSTPDLVRSWLPAANNSSSGPTPMLNGKDQQGCCNSGHFYKSKDFETFMSTSLGHRLVSIYGFVFCTGTGAVTGPLLTPGGDGAAFCYCDCHYAHGSKEDEVKFPGVCGQDPKLQPQVTLPAVNRLNSSGTENVSKRILEEDLDLCASGLTGLTKLICDEIKEENDNEFYTTENGVAVYKEDVCSIDCYFTHGFRKEPYGRCCITGDGVKYCKCVT